MTEKERGARETLSGNFKPYTDMTDDEKKAFHILGGYATMKKKQERRKLRQYLETLLDSPTDTGNVEADITGALIQRALNGDVKAYETIRATLGEDEPQKLEVDNNIIKVTVDDE